MGQKASKLIAKSNAGKKWFEFGCKYCGLRFLSKEILDEHLKQHDGLFCSKGCDKLFASKEEVKEHEVNCDGVKIEIKIEENHPKKTVKRKVVAIGEKTQWQCLDCGKYFPS